jgi:hypothetical protein
MRRFAKPLYGLTPVPRVRIPPSPPDNLDCREFPPQISQQFPNDARFLRFSMCELDCGERTPQATKQISSASFSKASLISATLN